MTSLKVLIHCDKCGYTNNLALPTAEKEPQMVYCSNCSTILFQIYLESKNETD